MANVAEKVLEPVREAQRPEASAIDGWRWLALGVFVLFSALNYLDRQLLAAVAPSIKAEFSLSNADYGAILSAFSMAYLIVTPVAGWLVDRVGLKLGATCAITMWSLAGITTGLAQTLRGLVTARAALACAEAAGIPSASKATATYLRPGELSLGDASHAVGITLGAVGAPLVVALIAPHYGWRAAFVVCGVAGLLWVPLWLFTAHRIPPAQTGKGTPVVGMRDVLGRGPLWTVLIANIMIMTVYSLWMNWTTVYFVQERQMSQVAANQYFAWIPPVFATLGGFVGAGLALARIRKGQGALAARLRVCMMGAPIVLVTASVPFLPTPALAAGAISLSFFGCMMMLTSLHVIPIDLFGVGRAAFSASLLTCSYALMQTVLSPTIGALVDRAGFQIVCVALSVFPLCGAALLRRLRPRGPIVAITTQ